MSGSSFQLLDRNLFYMRRRGCAPRGGVLGEGPDRFADASDAVYILRHRCGGTGPGGGELAHRRFGSTFVADKGGKEI